MKIGLKIKELMIQENIEVSELAKKIGKTKQAIYDMLDKEDVNTSLLKQLATVFNVPITTFFETTANSQHAQGSSNILVGRDNNGQISVSECQDKLEDALLEIEHLKELIDGKNKLIEEKERLITVLMNK